MKIMILVLLDGESRMELSIGLLETLGVAIGEKEEISDLLEVRIISILRRPVHGPLLRILGLKIYETKRSLKSKIGNLQSF
jgi:hypothetical protein